MLVVLLTECQCIIKSFSGDSTKMTGSLIVLLLSVSYSIQVRLRILLAYAFDRLSIDSGFQEKRVLQFFSYLLWSLLMSTYANIKCYYASGMDQKLFFITFEDRIVNLSLCDNT